MDKISFKKFIGKKIIDINEMYPILIFDGEEGLTIECPWRLRNDEMILLGSSEYNHAKTHSKAHEQLSNMLLGQGVMNIIITSVTSDLAVKFDNGLLLELFSNSNIYESWTLADGKDFILVSLPGGKPCLFGR